MVFIVDRKNCHFQYSFCHKIIQYRNKFLIDNNFPKKTNINLFPSSHLPINFINQINDEIFGKINNYLLDEISLYYSVKKEDLSINIVFYVENSYYCNENYEKYKENNYQYGFIIPLNENTFYSGGEICHNNIELKTNNDILLFSVQDKINIRNILTGEQHKLIGYINHRLHQNENNKQLYYFINKQLNLMKNTCYLHFAKEILSNENCDFLCKALSLDNIKQNESIQINNDTSTSSYVLDDLAYIDLIKNIQDYINHKTINEILINFNIRKENVLPIKINIIKKDIELTYFSPIILNQNNMKNITERKLTMLLKINNTDSSINFPNQNAKFDLEKGDCLIVPNSFLFSYYIQLKKPVLDNMYIIELSFF